MQRPTRRPLLAWLLPVLLTLVACAGPAGQSTKSVATPPAAVPQTAPAELPPLFADIEKRTFDYFWETTNPVNGLVPDRWPTESFASIAAVGFGLTAYGIGVEQGWISRAQAVERTLATLRFFDRAPQGPEPSGVAGHRGFFYHFLDMDTGQRHGRTELSSVDTALLLGGVLFAQSYYDADEPAEAEIRALAERIYGRVEWPWLQERGALIAMGWHPETGVIAYDWNGYNEALLVYLLALASPTHPVGEDAYAAWTSTYDRSWGDFHGQEHLNFAPLFGHQFSHAWVDFRGIQDDYMRAKGIDYFENSRRATLAQRAYAIANPDGWRGYGADVWGLTASDGPTDAVLPYRGRDRRFHSYTARGAALTEIVDDGTLVPTAALSSLPFAPEVVVPAVLEMHRRYGRHIYAKYGFLDAFNPSFRDTGVPLLHGRVIPDFGWVDGDYLGIDQGPILLMMANHRDGFVWQVMRRNPHLRRGLARAGFRGGWLQDTAPAAAWHEPAPATRPAFAETAR